MLVGPERRGQIHVAENSRRRAARRRHGDARTRPQREGRLLLAVSRGHAQSETHRAGRSARHAAPGHRAIRPHRCSASFLFRGDDVFKTVSVLSGGEKSRLALVKLLLDPPNLLLMDEPTTHLDMASIDALLCALDQFEGTLIFISHDVYFIRALANTVLHVNAGKLTHYAGDYEYYLDKTKALSARAALTSNGEKKLHNAQPAVEHHTHPSREKKKPGMRETREARRAEADRRKMEAKTKREREKRLHDLTQHIISLEVRQKELTAELEKPDTYNAGGSVMQLNRELLAVTEDLARVTEEWEGATLPKAES